MVETKKKSELRLSASSWLLTARQGHLTFKTVYNFFFNWINISTLSSVIRGTNGEKNHI